MFSFKFENCEALAACGLFCKGWGVVATPTDKEGTADDSVKVFLKLEDKELGTECPDFNRINYGDFYEKVKNQVVKALKGNPVWFGKDPNGTYLETVQYITADCYQQLYEKENDCRLVFSIIHLWAMDFEKWWWSLTEEEREEKDFIISLEEFEDKKLNEYLS